MSGIILRLCVEYWQIRRDTMDWITGIQNAIDYIEEHLTETIDYDIVAEQSFSSTYHFQRIFSILCGFTVGEYI